MPDTPYDAYDSSGRRKYLTLREGSDFLKAARSLAASQRLFCELAYYSGCRISEVLQVAVEDIDRPEGALRVRCLKKRGKIVTRRIPIPGELVESLVCLADPAAEKLWPFSRMTGWRIIKEAMQMASIQGIHASPKGLRHGFGVRAILANVPVSTVQKWMGHSHPLTTAIYLAVRDEEERTLMARTWK